DWLDIAREDVEVTVHQLVEDQVRLRRHDGLAAAVRVQAGLDDADKLVGVGLQRFDLRAVENSDADLRHGKMLLWTTAQRRSTSAMMSISMRYSGLARPCTIRPVDTGNTPFSHLPTTR